MESMEEIAEIRDWENIHPDLGRLCEIQASFNHGRLDPYQLSAKLSEVCFERSCGFNLDTVLIFAYYPETFILVESDGDGGASRMSAHVDGNEIEIEPDTLIWAAAAELAGVAE